MAQSRCGPIKVWVREGSNAKRDGLTTFKSQYFKLIGEIRAIEKDLEVVEQWND
jgi:hypothetical protein